MFKTREDSPDVINEDNRDAYPDFYNDNCVLDAKYKHLENKVQRSDLYQVISYMHTMPRKIGGYIYPYQTKTKNIGIDIGKFELHGDGPNESGGNIFTIPFRIPYYDSSSKDNSSKDNSSPWNRFAEEMQQAEDSFKKDIKNMMINVRQH